MQLLFASAVVVLAGLAVLGALALVIVWACAIRHTLQAYRHQPSHQEPVPGDRVSVLPARRP